MGERVDDPTIGPDDKLWRRISPLYLKTEGPAIGIMSAAFRDKTGEMSVHRVSLTTQDKVLADYPDFSLAEFPASLPRGLGLVVCPDPTEDDPSHALICPAATKGQAKKLAAGAELVVLRRPPEGGPPEPPMDF